MYKFVSSARQLVRWCLSGQAWVASAAVHHVASAPDKTGEQDKILGSEPNDIRIQYTVVHSRNFMCAFPELLTRREYLNAYQPRRSLILTIVVIR